MILAHTPTIKEPATMPYRIVLHTLNGKYVTHLQIMEGKGNYSDGHYFADFADAYADFIQRAQKQLGYYGDRCQVVFSKEK